MIRKLKPFNSQDAYVSEYLRNSWAFEWGLTVYLLRHFAFPATAYLPERDKKLLG